ncbi:hypothetical protein Tco_0274082, partial [Tanacetum coccineum]
QSVFKEPTPPGSDSDEADGGCGGGAAGADVSSLAGTNLTRHHRPHLLDDDDVTIMMIESENTLCDIIPSVK